MSKADPQFIKDMERLLVKPESPSMPEKGEIPDCDFDDDEAERYVFSDETDSDLEEE